METQTEREPLLTTAEACAYLAVGRHTLLALIRRESRPLPVAGLVGNSRRFRRADLDEWIKGERRENER